VTVSLPVTIVVEPPLLDTAGPTRMGPVLESRRIGNHSCRELDPLIGLGH
jgi:hypothetical protein